MLAPLQIPPGIYRNGTNYQARGRWFDANMMRFFEGTKRPIGGCVKLAATALTGKCRGMNAWAANNGTAWAGLGTMNKLYVYNGQVFDVTPAGYTVGIEDSFYGSGYGAGLYGQGNYNESQTSSVPTHATTWSLDNWGQYLVGCANSDGKIYEWQLVTTTPAAVVTNAPTGCHSIFVTNERHLVALGASGDPRKIQWCSQDDNTVWTPTVTNTAGSLIVQTAGKLVGGRRTRGGGLLWTDQDLHILNYLGAPAVYGVEQAGADCGAIGPSAMTASDQGALWMGKNAFYFYNGSVAPIPCDVSDYVFGDLNVLQGAKVWCGRNSAFGEVWWFYPSAGSLENDRYVLYNTRERHWNIGNTLPRTAWVDTGVFNRPLAVGADRFLYEQESGWTNSGMPIRGERYFEAGPAEIAEGSRVQHVNRVVPDERTAGQTQVSFKTRLAPNAAELQFGPYMLHEFTDVRLTGRQVAVRIEGVADADWRVGDVRFQIVPGGLR